MNQPIDLASRAQALRGILGAATALGNDIRLAGSLGVPEGVVTAAVVSAGLPASLAGVIVDGLVGTGLVARRAGPRLVWIGPADLLLENLS